MPELPTGGIAIVPGSKDYEIRMTAAKARATWELGDPRWAGIIIGAFLYPASDLEALEAEVNE